MSKESNADVLYLDEISTVNIDIVPLGAEEKTQCVYYSRSARLTNMKKKCERGDYDACL